MAVVGRVLVLVLGMDSMITERGTGHEKAVSADIGVFYDCSGTTEVHWDTARI